MQYELMIAKGKDDAILSYLKKFDFVTVRKRATVSKRVSKKITFSYFDAMPEWDTDAGDLRKNKFRKTSVKWELQIRM
jgi:hypothetical protein